MSGTVIKHLRYFNHTAHKDLWDWLANNPIDKKSHWPGWAFYGKDVLCDCFACESARTTVISVTGTEKCEVCPLVWGETNTRCVTYADDGEPLGMYCKWDFLEFALLFGNRDKYPDFLQERVKLARQIRDLPLRPDLPNDPFITVVI